ncbi:helicase-related protein [Gemmobacter nanjingensis]|uniref:helicase-related protein n=1 Tax=Gemmobacter nanjingensis TaxID=488454 RepID=UPI001E547697|nr:helicase-related protein [Gemmobacter nanjingensis]
MQKITGKVDKVGKLIRSFRNDPLPKVAVTVDLLTTGIDVPRISNLVFMRRVNSRILYEQMLGRATRLCPEIDKESFRIFDAVDLYAHLQNLTDMRPVAADPSFTLTKLFEELSQRGDAVHKERVREQIVVRLRRRLRRLSPEARARFEKAAGETPEESLQRFISGDASALAEWAAERPSLGPILDWTSEDGTPNFIPISEHPDRVTTVSRGYGTADRPEDFLDAFATFVRSNVNTIAALKVMAVRDYSAVTLAEPIIDPRGLGFSGVLTDIFGLPSTLDKPTQIKIDRRNTLAAQEELSPALAKEFEKINAELRHLGFLYEERDKLYSRFLRQLGNVELADVEPLTPEELRAREEETRMIVETLIGKK